MQKTFIILIFLLTGCGTTSKNAAARLIAEKNKDILILSSLASKYMATTDGRDFGLPELMKIDSSKRICNNFDKITLKSRGGYISVLYKLSAARNASVELTDKETAMLNGMRWNSKKMDEQYDGEIRIDYGERFYRIKKIIVQK